MRRLITSLSMRQRIDAATEFLQRAAGQEILIVAATRTAAHELVRELAGAADGVFGVHRFTLPQLAAEIAAGCLAESGLTVLGGVALEAMAARAVQSTKTAGRLQWFGPVAGTPGFYRALAATIAELRSNDVPAGAVVTAGPSGRDLAALLQEFDENLARNGAADLPLVYRTAIDVIRNEDFVFRGLPLLLFDAVPRSALERRMLAALAAAASDVLATAHARDRDGIAALENAAGAAPEFLAHPVSSALDRLRAFVFESDAPESAIDPTVEFLSAADESRECVEIARAILAASRSGTPFDRMAVVLRNPDRYQPLLEDALRRAEIPAFHTHGARRPNPAGRSLLALLACAAEGLSATRFSEYLSLGQAPRVDSAGKPAPRPPGWVPVQGELFPDAPAALSEPAGAANSEDPEAGETDREPSPVIAGSLRTPYQWERMLVDAAVIGGRARWERRLAGLHNELLKQMAEVDGDDEAQRQRMEMQVERLGNLRRFALPVIDLLDRLPQHSTWDVWLDALEELAVLAIRRPEPILSVLAELRPMGSVGPVGLDEIREVLTGRLGFLRAEPPDRRYGKVFVTAASELAGFAFDVVFLPGLAEDIFPRRPFEDPLLLDAARLTIGSGLATQKTRIAAERMLFHAAAGAAAAKLWVSYPRMDLDQGRPRSPSFYALDVLRAVTGRIPGMAGLERHASALSSQPGWPAPRNPAEAIDDAEYDLAAIGPLLRLSSQERRGRGRYLVHVDATLARSLRTRFGRWLRSWFEGDGIIDMDGSIVAALAQHRPTARPYSATALQQFAACPYRFALHSVHRIAPRTESVAIERMDPLTRGSLFHAVQFELLSELRTRGLLPVRPDNLSDASAAADRVLTRIAAAYREELAPAIPRVWESEVEDIRWDLRGWLREVSLSAAADSWTPRWFELAFGLPRKTDRDPESSIDPIELPGGVRVRGAIDMVEEKDGAIRITDHKTGKAPTQHLGAIGYGETLQPVLYAQAAETLLGRPATWARLFFCTQRGGYRVVEVRTGEQERAHLATAIAAVEASMTEGFLPAAPRAGACTYCDYRPICGPYEESRILRKSSDRLERLNALRAIP